MKRLWILVVAATAVFIGVPTAAGASPPPRPTSSPRGIGACEVIQSSVLTPAWSVRCNADSAVSVAIAYRSVAPTVPARVDVFNSTENEDVAAGATWSDGIFVPADWYIFHVCVTITANGSLVGSSCFDRPQPATAFPATPCGLGSLGAVAPTWEAGCSQAETVGVAASYAYTMPGSAGLHVWAGASSRALVARQTWDGHLAPPAGSVLADSVVTVTAGATLLGVATFWSPSI
jgi:hypothetical protein